MPNTYNNPASYQAFQSRSVRNALFCAMCLFTAPLVMGYAAPHAAPYAFPATKQGIADVYNSTSNLPLRARYAAMQPYQFGLKRYNYAWDSLENSAVAAAKTPLHCPDNYVQVPASDALRSRLHYYRFHCYNSEVIAQFDELLGLDQEQDIQSIAVLWGTPALYRHAQCDPGNALGGAAACVPDAAHLHDYEDYVTFLASRYNGGLHGKISHFIVWHAANNGHYFNLSPLLKTQSNGLANRLESERDQALDAAQTTLWTDTYVRLLRHTLAAVARHQPANTAETPAALVHASIDQHFTLPATSSPDGPAQLSGKNILDATWQQLGTAQDWSVAVHPNFELTEQDSPGSIDLSGLTALSNYQEDQLARHGALEPLHRPQYWLLVGGQNHPEASLATRAANLCKAHAVVMSMPNVIGTTHLYFQSLHPSDDNQAFLPAAAGALLQNAVAYPTAAAYQATSPTQWGQSNAHYCCRQHQLGCAF